MITDFNDIRNNQTLIPTNNLILSEADAYKKMGILAGANIVEVNVKEVIRKQEENRSSELVKKNTSKTK